MKPTNETRNTFSSDMPSATFGISEENASHIMGILRDGIIAEYKAMFSLDNHRPIDENRREELVSMLSEEDQEEMIEWHKG